MKAVFWIALLCTCCLKPSEGYLTFRSHLKRCVGGKDHHSNHLQTFNKWFAHYSTLNKCTYHYSGLFSINFSELLYMKWPAGGVCVYAYVWFSSLVNVLEWIKVPARSEVIMWSPHVMKNNSSHLCCSISSNEANDWQLDTSLKLSSEEHRVHYGDG